MADERVALDRSTLVAVALAVYALVNLAHEGLGHGGACLLAGGEPQALDELITRSKLRPRALRLMVGDHCQNDVE